MNVLRKLMFGAVAATVILSGCKSMNKTQKGAVIGTAGGGAAGAVIGRAAGNTALGAIIGATVGGVTGAVIGRKMDKQAEEIKKEVPGAKVERVGEGIVVEFNNAILFGFDRSDLSSTAKNNLEDLKTILGKYADTDIEIQGHTDSDGADDYNLSLSRKRANAVEDYLSSIGVKNARMSTKAFGETAPKYANNSEENKSQNRRVEFLITANDKMKSDARKEANTTGE